MRAPLRTCSEFPELSCRLFSELHQRQSMRLHRATVGYISVHLSLYYSTNGGCRVSPGTPVSLRFVPHAHGSEVRSLPLIITCPFAEPLCSCSPPCLSVFSRWNHTRAENKATAHNRVVLGRRIRTRGVRQIKHLGTRLQQGFWAGWPAPSVPCLC